MNPLSPLAVLAHGYLFAYEVTPEGALWQNTDLLHEAPALADRLHHFDSLLHPFYAVDTEPDGFTLFAPANGPLHPAIAAVARQLAYTPVPLDPRTLAVDLTNALTYPSDRSQHIGSHPIRLHAFVRWIATNAELHVQDLTTTLAYQKTFIQNEFQSIAAAFSLAAGLDGPPAEIVNKETLLAKRTRITFTL